MGKGADYQFTRTMLSNIYLIPSLLGSPIEKVDMWHSSNWAHEDYIQDFPEQILDAITDEDLDWIAALYNSEPFQKVLDRYIDINHQLQTTLVGDARNELVRESHSLLDQFRFGAGQTSRNSIVPPVGKTGMVGA
jgi:hypothetical protein